MDFLKLRQQAIKEKVPIINSSTEKIISYYLGKYKPVNAVEIGTAIGYSTLLIAKQIEKTGGILTTFEVSYPSYKQALENFHIFQQYNITAYNIDPLLVNIKNIFTKKNIDFLFIDGVMKLYLDFYLKFKDFLAEKSVILLDNVVKFKSKTQPLYEFLGKNQINYKIFKTSYNDGVMVIENGI